MLSPTFHKGPVGVHTFQIEASSPVGFGLRPEDYLPDAKNTIQRLALQSTCQ